jgi:hypothetical protein
MSKFWHAALHVLAIALQIVNVVATPSPYQLPVTVTITALQGVLAVANHGSN